MLLIIKSMHQLKFSELMSVYAESNFLNGKERYSDLSQEAQIYEAEQDFYQYLSDVFFRQDRSFYAVWEDGGRYVSALRVEPYQTGMLICGLETLPEFRKQGYASKLMLAVLSYLAQIGILQVYSHVCKKNLPSLGTHLKCGFEIMKDYAVYSDGSVLHTSYTLLFEYKKSET